MDKQDLIKEIQKLIESDPMAVIGTFEMIDLFEICVEITKKSETK